MSVKKKTDYKVWKLTVYSPRLKLQTYIDYLDYVNVVDIKSQKLSVVHLYYLQVHGNT